MASQALMKLALNLTLLLLIAETVQAQSALEGFDPGANGQVLALVTQPDGKIVIGGSFTTLGGGGTGTTTRNHIARLNQDGTLDSTFNPGVNGPVAALAIQADGKILVGGFFSTLGGGGTGTSTRNFIGRLNPDGTLDTSFDPGADSGVYTLAVQADGKILVGGYFFHLGGGGVYSEIERISIGRLNEDGTVDMGFDPGTSGGIATLFCPSSGRENFGGWIFLRSRCPA